VDATGNTLNSGSQFSVNYGSTLYFKVTNVDSCYSNATPYISITGGTMGFMPDSNGIYTVSDIVGDLTLFVEDMPLDTHYVILTENDYLSFTYLTYEDVTFGSSFSFTVSVNAAYDQSEPEFKFNGNYDLNAYGGLEYSDGVYTISHVTSNITVTVSQMPVNQYDVEFDGDDYLSGSLNVTYLYHGGNASLTVYANYPYTQAFAAAGSWGQLFYISGTYGQVSLSNGVYTISNVQSDLTITAQELSINEYTVTFDLGDYGTIEWPMLSFDSITVFWGEDFSFSFVLAAGYSQANVSDSSFSIYGSYSGYSSYTIYGIESDITIAIISLDPNVYEVTLATQNEDENNFNIDIAGFYGDITYIQHGFELYFYITLTTGEDAPAHTLTVYVDNVELSPDQFGSYSFTVTNDTTVTVVLTLD
jgi:hypothetical protein